MQVTDDDKVGGIGAILSQKKELARLFLIAAMLGFGVGTLASLTAGQHSIPAWSIATVSGLLIILSFLLLMQDLLAKLLFEDKARAIVFIDPAQNKLIPVEDYRFSESLYRTMRAVAAESKAIHADWDNDPLVSPPKAQRERLQKKADAPRYATVVKVSKDQERTPTPKSARLLEEAAHFVLLEELSLHLSTYFNDRDDDAYIHEISREDIPDFLLKNRVLNLLCTPIEQRDIFLTAFPERDKRPNGVIYSLFGSDGSVFSRFDLILPHGSSVHASSDGGITIETRRLSLTIKATYTETSASPSHAFVEQYIKVPYSSIASRNVIISMSGRVKPFSLLTSSGWQYYRWLDSFRRRLQLTCDFESFQKAINWRIVETFLQTISDKNESNHMTTSAKKKCGHVKDNVQQDSHAEGPASGGPVI